MARDLAYSLDDEQDACQTITFNNPTWIALLKHLDGRTLDAMEKARLRDAYEYIECMLPRK